MAADISNTRKVRDLADRLRDECALRGVDLLVAEAREIIVRRVQEVAQMLGVSERTVLDRYMTEDTVLQLASSVGRADSSYHEIRDAVAPVQLSMAEAGRLLASLGMVAKLATEALDADDTTVVDRSSALGVATDCADAVVGMGAAFATTAGLDVVEIGGQGVTFARKVLQQAIDLLGNRNWTCPCFDQHRPGQACNLQQSLATDLDHLGGPLPRPPERDVSVPPELAAVAEAWIKSHAEPGDDAPPPVRKKRRR